MSNRFTSRLSDNDDFKRDELIRKIEHAVEHMTLAELEALSYDMFTKGYIQDYLTFKHKNKTKYKKGGCYNNSCNTHLFYILFFISFISPLE